ncbi:MAG: hypothetical protein AB1753_09945, partial [Thermoproteota archaeon]
SRTDIWSPSSANKTLAGMLRYQPAAMTMMMTMTTTTSCLVRPRLDGAHASIAARPRPPLQP